MHILLGLLVAFVIVVIMTRARAATRGCRWRAARSGDRGALRKYVCMACGEEAYTSSDAPPRTCHNPQRTRR